ncbi:MAG TPA: alkaline phosphatase family protein, partial [Rhodothermales bacterium]|nr:alkaline phosphatase family protein [Rhodothermales bacterium]
MSERIARKVLIIGWDAADWKVIRPLMEAGHMPTLSALVARGVSGNIATLDPPFSPMLWTSIATGHTADRHGVINFVQPNAAGDDIRPVLGTTRRVKALWNILTQSGLTSNVVGWWPSHPAEPIRGVMASDFAHRATKPAHVPWLLPQGAIHPPELADRLAALRVHPGELTGSILAPFIPEISGIDARSDNRVGMLAKNIADAASLHAITTYLLEHTEWDLTAVYFDAIDHIGHGFMRFHPPQLDGVPDEDFRLYRHVVEGMYRFHDMMLERQLALAGEDTTVILLSDHGFHSDHLRPKSIPKMPAGPAIEHRTFGVLVMAGPGIQKGEPLYGASLLNIAPTVLTLFGLPVGSDMPARPLLQAFETPPAVETIPSWEDVPGDAGTHSEEARSDPWAEQEAMRQLIELGYVEATTGDGVTRADNAAREAAF